MRALRVRAGPWSAWLARTDRVARLWPGVALCGVIALAAVFVAGLQGGLPMLYALLFGAAFHPQGQDPRHAPGVDLCMRGVLRLGIGLLGARITLGQIADLGWTTALTTVAAVAGTVLCGLVAARCLRLPWGVGLLAGGATAICGAAAALAIAAVLPRDDDREPHTLAVVVLATLLSTAAMLVYPLIARGLSLSPAWAGVFIGGTIHDVAHVVVAGYSLGPQTGDTATVVKLLRVSLLAVVVTIVAAACARIAPAPTGLPARRPGLPVPGFLWLFLLLVGAHSAGWLPARLQEGLVEGSRACLLLGVTALGMKTSFGRLARTGWRPVALMLVTTAWIAATVLAAALLSNRG